MEKRRQLSFQIFEKPSLNSILIETERSMLLGNEEEFDLQRETFKIAVDVAVDL